MIQEEIEQVDLPYVRAYRRWRILFECPPQLRPGLYAWFPPIRCDPDVPPRLVSYGANDIWNPEEEKAATCNGESRGVQYILLRILRQPACPKHPQALIPYLKGYCGIWGTREPLFTLGKELQKYEYAIVSGVVLLKGDIVVHENGYRASRATLASIEKVLCHLCRTWTHPREADLFLCRFLEQGARRTAFACVNCRLRVYAIYRHSWTVFPNWFEYIQRVYSLPDPPGEFIDSPF